MCRAPVALLLIAAMPLASQEPPELVEHKDASGKVILRLPKAWKTKREPSNHKQLILILTVTIPGDEHPFRLEVISLTMGALRPEAQAWYEVLSEQARSRSKAMTVRSEPVTHILADASDSKQERVSVTGIRRFRCRGIHIRFTGARTTWGRPNFQAAFFNTVQGIVCDLPRWPGMPLDKNEYHILKKDGLVFYIQRGVSEKGRRRIENFVCSTQRKFVKFHGGIPRPDDEPPLIFIHRDVAMHGLYSKTAAKQYEGMYAQTRARRVFTVPYEGSSRYPEAALAQELTELFLEERYGTVLPLWFHHGECYLAYTRHYLGRGLPFIDEGFAAQRTKATAKLTELQHMGNNKPAEYYLNAKAYCAFFHAGPAKYRRAYRAFLSEYGDTCNSQGAVSKHLYSLDQNQMYKDMRRFLEKRLRPLKAE